MIRSALAVLALCCLAAPAQAQYRFAGDRYAWGGMGSDVVKAIRCAGIPCRHVVRVRKRKAKVHHHERAKVAARPDLLAGGKVYVKPLPRKPTNIFKGFAREIVRALPGKPRGRSLAGVVAPLAAKANELVDRCGSRVTSGVRHSYVAGTRRISLHASGRAVDMAGNPSCMYALLRNWPGGYSIDYGRVKHIHISYAPPSRGQRGREWGVRFAHHHVGRRTRYARHHHKHYASAR